MDYSKPGQPHYSDKETREKALLLMRTYFEIKPAEPVPVLFKSFEVPKQNSQTTTILFDDVNRIPLDRLSDLSWKAHFPGATEDFYQKLANPGGCNTQQDLLKDENLLKELTGNVYFKSERICFGWNRLDLLRRYMSSQSSNVLYLIKQREIVEDGVC